MAVDIFADFQLVKKVSKDVLEKYQAIIPEELLEIWEKHGFGSMLNGYLKIVNPEDFQSLLEDSYVRHGSAVVLFSTSMGDLLVWEKNRYLKLLNYRKGNVKGIYAGFRYFFLDLRNEISTYEKDLEWQPYPKAVELYGKPEYNECFGYVPLLGIGGSEKVENLTKVKLKEHICLITQFMGPIE